MPSSFLCVLLALAIVLPAHCDENKRKTPLPPLAYNNGELLTGNVDIGVIWYGNVTDVQRNKVLTFIKSLNADSVPPPSVNQWWKMVESYQKIANKPLAPIIVKVVSEKNDVAYSKGKVLVKAMMRQLIDEATGGNEKLLALIVASDGVTVQNMCAGSCWQHNNLQVNDKTFAYIAIGNPVNECPVCSWPFMPDVHAPPGSLVLRPPSANVAADTMVMSLAGGLMGAVTNPFGDGFCTEHRGDDIDVVDMCKGIFGSKSGPGNPGTVLIDPAKKGSYNAQGAGHHKFLLPAIWNPETESCWTLL